MGDHVVGDAPKRMPAWRLLGIAAMIVALYLALTWVSADVELRPGWLLAALVGGPAVGVMLARFQSPEEAPERGRQRPRTHSAPRSVLVGLTGVALILAQLLSGDGMSWLLLAGAGFVMCGAAYEWARKPDAGVEIDRI